MTPAQVEQHERMRNAALRSYAQMHDRFSELEQLNMDTERPIEAEGARIYAQRVLRAWLAERDDPAPADDTWRWDEA